MAEQKNIINPEFTKLTEAIAYFLAGLFAISATLIHVSGENITIEAPNAGIMVAISSWLTLVIGAILILAGFFLLLALVNEFVGKAWNKVEKFLIPALFMIITTEVVSRAFYLRKIMVLFIPTVVFGVFILLVIVIKASWYPYRRI
jgi:hypothetical protein